MAEPEKDFDKLREEQAQDDADLLADLDKETKEFDKVAQSHVAHYSPMLMNFSGLGDRQDYESLPCQRLRHP